MKTINDWVKDIHENAEKHGWWEDDRSIAEVIALCHSELSEALEEARRGKEMVYHGIDGKPEGIAVEMADCIIRIMDWFGKEHIDLELVMDMKHGFNKQRPYKHGKKF